MEDIKTLCQSETFNTRTIPVLTYSIKQAEQGRTGYFYEFDHDIPGEDRPGPYHGSELWFTFDSLARCWRPFTGKHYDLARQVCTYWTNFVKTGNPNGLDSDGTPLPDWQAYTLDNPFIMEFTDVPARKTQELSASTQYRIQYHLGKHD
jgi:para-nitrobenzyl esterase